MMKVKRELIERPEGHFNYINEEDFLVFCDEVESALQDGKVDEAMKMLDDETSEPRECEG
jgi:hypothetical protein